MGSHGFPNLFMVTGPLSAVALYNNPLAIEIHVEFAAEAVRTMLERGDETIEVTTEAEQQWSELAASLLDMTLLSKANSWYMGSNVPGKPRAAFVFASGGPLYNAICAEVEATDYAGFAINGVERPLSPTSRICAGGLGLVSGMLAQGMPPLEAMSAPEIRAVIDSFVGMQLPPVDGVTSVDTTFPTAAGERPARVFTPEGGTDHKPLVMFIHGGGFVAGSIEVVDEPCRALAKEMDAIVVAPSYRLAPEHAFPAAPDDMLDALRWCAEQAEGLGADPQAIFVAGESAGGTLAAVTAIRARDEGGPRTGRPAAVLPGQPPGLRGLPLARGLRRRAGPDHAVAGGSVGALSGGGGRRSASEVRGAGELR